MGLNTQQKEVEQHREGPLLVVAGAGSGKTLAITHRIAALIQSGTASADEILALTFTNKAAKEMRDRVHRLVAANVMMGTFHSFCVRILRQYADMLGYMSGFTIYDEADQQALIKTVMATLGMAKDTCKPSDIAFKISRLKEELVTPDGYVAYAISPYEKDLSRLYAVYQEEMKRANAVDFSDLIFLTVQLFQSCPDILARYHDMYAYILVDEYQDTNAAQYRLIHLLADKHKNICVVGDPDQSIYGWRGADISNILNFETDYPTARVIHLEKNYRSTEVILTAANHVIEKNTNRKPKRLLATKQGGDKIGVYQALDARDEAEFIAGKMTDMYKQGRSYRDMAVFYRMHALSRVVEEALIMQRIPYVIIGGVRFYDRKEIKDILAYLRFIANPYDRVSFERIINVPKRKIGGKSVEKLVQFALDKEISFFDAALRVGDIDGISPQARKNTAHFATMLQPLCAKRDTLPVLELAEALIEAIAYDAYLKDYDMGTYTDRRDNIRELLSSIAEYQEHYNGRLAEYLEYISLVSSVDTLDETRDTVTLMTLHNAKGLEFDTVFMMALEEGIFPTASSMGLYDEMEEERRLCYVGMTRAKDTLFITSARRRLIYGRWESYPPSSFLGDIPADYAMPLHGASYVKDTPVFVPETLGDDVFSPEYQPGVSVFHHVWGMGHIVERKGLRASDAVVHVNFECVAGYKRLMLEFAKLSIVSS